MNIQPKKYCRKPFDVEAIEVTDENMDAVAKWCNGEIKTGKAKESDPTRYIQVEVHRPIHPNQTKAYPGNWILKSGSNFKVYTDKAFKSTFDPAEQPATV